MSNDVYFTMPRRRAHFFSHAVSLVYRYRPLHRSRNFANSTAHNNGQQNSQQECRIDTRHTSRQRVRHVCYSPRAKRYEHTEAWSARAPIPLLYGQRTVEPCRKRYPLLWQHAGHFPEEGEEGERKCTGSGSGVLIYSRASRRPAFDAVFEPPSNTENSTGEMPPQTYHSIRIPSLSHLATYCTTGCSHPINFTPEPVCISLPCPKRPTRNHDQVEHAGVWAAFATRCFSSAPFTLERKE